MSELDGLTLDFPNMDLTPAPPRRTSRAFAVKHRRDFYRQHELAIWILINLLLAAGCYMALANNADIIWRLSTPLMGLIP